MPRSEDYNKKTKYDQLFMSMDDDQFLAFVKEDDIEANFNNLTEAEKTAFLIRSLMIGENSTEFKNDVIYRRNYFREEGPKEIEEASKAKENINDPYGSDREFHYDVYRRLIYNDMMTRAIAGNIIRYVSPSEIIKDREKYRDLIVGDLTIPKEADDEITEDLKKGAKDRRKEFLDEIDQKIKDKIDAGKDAPDEEKKAQDPEELLASFDDELTSPEQKANLLIGYVLRNAKKKEAEKAIENLQNQKNMKELIDSYAQNMKSADIKKDEARLHSVITGDSAAQNCAVQLQQKVYKVRKANGKLTNKEQADEKKREIAEQKRQILKEEQIKAEKAKEDQKKRIENEKKQQEIDRKNQIEGYFTSGRKIGPDSKGRTWAVYADKHTPSELLQYSDAQKAEMLSKMMVGRRLQMVNGMNQNRIISFNLDSARKLAKDIQNSPAFKEIVRTKEVDTYLAKARKNLPMRRWVCSTRLIRCRLKRNRKYLKILRRWLISSMARETAAKNGRDSREVSTSLIILNFRIQAIQDLTERTCLKKFSTVRLPI